MIKPTMPSYLPSAGVPLCTKRTIPWSLRARIHPDSCLYVVMLGSFWLFLVGVDAVPPLCFNTAAWRLPLQFYESLTCEPGKDYLKARMRMRQNVRHRKPRIGIAAICLVPFSNSAISEYRRRLFLSHESSGMPEGAHKQAPATDRFLLLA